MIHPRTLSLLITTRCDANCDHCTLSAAPNRREQMDEDLLLGAIEQAAKIRSIRLVAFTGGEPMLDYGRLRDFVAFAASKGLQSGLVSNSSWAQDEGAADERFAELAGLGLTIYITSLDEYHEKYIDPRAVRNAVHASLHHGIATHINALWTPGYAERLASLPELLDLAPAIVDGKGRHGLFIWMSVPALRRRVRNRAVSPPAALADPSLAGPCAHILRHPIVAVDGSLHACCGVADATPFGPAQFSKVGTLREHSLKHLRNQMRDNLLFNLLARIGPAGLLARVRKYEPSLPDAPQASNHCDICGLLMRPPWRAALADYLAALVAEQPHAESERAA